MNDYNIKKLYEDMEMELISSMKRNYQRHLREEEKTGFKYSQWQAEKLKELKRYQKENKNIIGGYTNGLSKEISKHMKEEVKQGSINAINQYNKIIGNKLKPSKVMNHSFFKTNDRKVNALIKVVNNDLKTANTAVLRMANDQYRQVIHKSAFYVANDVFTEQQAARMATKELTELQKTKLAIDETNKDFLNRGFNCIEYKDGRRVNIASYSQMAVRTANLRAQLMGEGDFRKSISRTLVQATSHGGACPICQKWEKHIFVDDVYSGGKADGKHTLLSEAMKQGFLHPNCRHGLTTYYPEVENIEDYTDEEYEEDVEWINNRINEITNGKLNYIDRNIKRFDRLENGSISPINIQMFANRKGQWINEKEKLINNSYVDITNQWSDISDVNNKETKILEKDEIFNYNGEKYIIDDHFVKYRTKQNEREFADWLVKKTGLNIQLNPEVEFPENISVADCTIYKKKQFLGNYDMKIVTGKSSQLLFHNVDGKEKQAKKFLFEATDSPLTINELVKQIDKLFKWKAPWVEEIGIKKGKQFLIFKNVNTKK
jgi:hypothetical protein